MVDGLMCESGNVYRGGGEVELICLFLFFFSSFYFSLLNNEPHRSVGQRMGCGDFGSYGMLVPDGAPK